MKKFGAAVLTLVLAVGFPMTAQAEISPSFARSAEEWARLRDNRLEWSEIPDLVHEYNTAVVNNWIQFARDEARGLNSDEYADQLRADAQQAYDDAVSADGATDATAVQAELAYKNAMAAADAATIDGEVVRMTYQQQEASVVAEVESQLVSWYTAKLQLEADQKTAAYQQTLYDAAVRRRDVGQATALEVLSAEESLKKAQAALITDETAVKQAKQTVLISLGWRYDAEPEMCEVPMPDAQTLAALNLEQDTAAAQEANWTLHINARKLANAKEDATKQQLSLSIKNGKEQVKSDLTAKYRAVLEAQSKCEQDALNVSNLQNTYERTKRNLALGSASERELEAAAYNLEQAELAQKMNAYALAQAYLNYQAARGGLASAGN